MGVIPFVEKDLMDVECDPILIEVDEKISNCFKKIKKEKAEV